MKIIDKIWDQGVGQENEDIFGQVGDFAWVLDGATALIKHPVYSPRWLVEEADKVLSAGVESCDSLQDMCDYYSCAFPVDAECGNLKTEHKPSYAAAIIRVKDDVLEYITFADCYVVLKNGEQITVLRDEIWANRPKKSNPKVMQAYLDMTEEEKLQDQIKSRSNMNKPDGYWIGTADGEAFRHNTPKTISVTPETEIILCSDGFEAAVDYGLYTWSEIFQTSLEKVLHDIRTAEQNDTAKTVYPRAKISDDATAIRLGL